MVVFEDPRENPWVAANRIRAEYLEMPGLSLTCQQAARLLGLDCLLTAAALDELQRHKFLVRTSKGQFVRWDTTLKQDSSAAVARASGGLLGFGARSHGPSQPGEASRGTGSPHACCGSSNPRG